MKRPLEQADNVTKAMNDTLKRMLNTPPKQHKDKPDSEKGKPKAGGKSK